MKAKQLLIPVAAFALTATSVNAFNPDILRNAGLSEEQVSAFEVAHELKKEGDRDAARDVLAEAGVDLDTLEEVRNAMMIDRQEKRLDVEEAVEENDYKAFSEAIKGSRLEENINSEDDFAVFVEAQKLRQSGDHKGAKELLESLGIEKPHHGHKMHKHDERDGEKYRGGE